MICFGSISIEFQNEHKNVEINDFESVGIPEKKINKEIKECKADLLVIRHHAHSFISWFIPFRTLFNCP